MTDEPTILAQRVSAKMESGDTAASLLGIRLEEVKPGYARMRMMVTPDHVNGHAMCHGGVIFALADTSFAHACNSRNVATVAAGADISFLSPARIGEELEAVAIERALGGRTGVYDIEIVEVDSRRRVALFRGRSHALHRPVVPEPKA
ncbi:MAG: paaI [Rhodospirillales bacterium]|nr:paaI [Rhodospirillales bacterium]